ncbi:MAG: hypothetical protein AAF702_46065 [Chloroflexota bacterium]
MKDKMLEELIIKWHRLFGLAVEQDFEEYNLLRIEREKALSIKEQLLDVLVVYTESMESLAEFLKKPPKPLPDGLDNLSQYNLITYKSLREALNEWTLQELIGHYVNYRKNTRPAKEKKLLPEEHFRLYAICTRFPQALMSKYEPNEIQQGVYEMTVIGQTVRVIVLSTIPKAERNAIWNIFSNVVENIQYGAIQYGPKLKKMSSVLDRLFEYYELEGIHVAYSFEQFEKEHFLDKAPKMLQDEDVQPSLLDTFFRYLSLDKILSKILDDEQRRQISVKEILARLSLNERLEGLSPDERLEGLSPDERLEGLSPDERLEGLSPDEIKAYMKKLEDSE